jgi:prolipoprotein diacylglyceryl transferase
MLASIPSPPNNGIDIGPLFIHAYGLAYVVGVLAAIAITTRRWEARGGSRDLVQEVAMWGFPAGLIGGRIYFLATSWNDVPHQWWGPLAIWQGGLGIWGGIAAGTLAGLWVLRRHRADVPAFLDAAAPGLLVAQAIGRLGNYFNQELFGGPTSLPWGLEIDPAHRPAGYAHYATFHPTFLYELIWNVALAGTLVWLGRRGRIRAPGLFALYITGYSGFRIFEELLRVDPAHHILGLRLNFYVATILFAAGLVWFARIQHPGSRAGRAVSRGGPAALGLAWIACSVIGCGGTHSARAATGEPPEGDVPVMLRAATPNQLDLQPSAAASSDSANILARWRRATKMDTTKGQVAYPLRAALTELRARGRLPG